MANFLHRFFNPHCPHCREEYDENRVCNSCEVLKIELEQIRFQNKQLLDTILEYTKPSRPEVAVVHDDNLKPISPSHIPWNVKKQQLELNSRKKLMEDEKSAEEAIMVERRKKELEELEKRVGVSDAN